MNRLFEIATALGEIAQSRVRIRRGIEALDKNIDTRKIDLIPDGGWPGGNADICKALEKQTLSNDPDLIRMEEGKQAMVEALDDLEIKRTALVEEKEAWQWTIRDSEVIAMLGSSVFDSIKNQGSQPSFTEDAHLEQQYEDRVSGNEDVPF